MQAVKRVITKMAENASIHRNTGRQFTAVVEGNMGSGKTTFLEHFRKYDDVCVISEPVENWRNLNGHNLLGLMYEDPQKWSFTFQSYVQLTMLQNHMMKANQPIKMIERSIYSARYCFVEKLKNNDLLPLPSAAVIDHWFKWIIAQNLVHVDLIIYLRTSPDVVLRRIMERKRPEEKTVSLEHLQSLHQFHEDWLYNKTSFTCPAPTLVLNGDLDKAVIESDEENESQIFSKLPLELAGF